MPDPKTKILKVALPVELYEQLEKAAAEDDRELDRFVVRMVRQHLENPQPKMMVVPVPDTRFVPANAVNFPSAPPPAQSPSIPTGRVIPLATKGGGEGVPIDLMSDNALNGEPEELENPMAPKVRIPVPNPKAPDLFGPSHKK